MCEYFWTERFAIWILGLRDILGHEHDGLTSMSDVFFASWPFDVSTTLVLYMCFQHDGASEGIPDSFQGTVLHIWSLEFIALSLSLRKSLHHLGSCYRLFGNGLFNTNLATPFHCCSARVFRCAQWKARFFAIFMHSHCI